MRGSSDALVALVVEDEWLLRSHLVGLLEDIGWIVHQAERGEVAIALIQQHEIDVLVTDIDLGGSASGWDVAEAMRARDPMASVIYASSNGKDRSRQVQDSLFFSKPYEESKLAAACLRLNRS